MLKKALMGMAMAMILGDATEARGLPQLAARFGAKIHEMHAYDERLMTLDCRTCHINPTGGGMRNAHGREFSIAQLPIAEKTETMAKAIQAAEINRYLSVGTDFRFAYLLSEQEGAPNEESFFPMQADLYVAFTPIDHLTFYYQDGVEGSRSRETFVLVDKLPFNAHLKLGRFIPPYGLKLADHTSFIRENLGFGAPSFGQDAGVEMGWGERYWFGNAAIFNGTGSSRDNNRAKGISVTGGFKSSLLWLAGSYFKNETTADERTYAGVYGAFHLGRLTLLGEWDRTIIETSTRTLGSAAYAELNVHVIRGIAARLKYDGYDPDRNVSDDELQRITFGLDVYPYPFTEVLIQYRRNLEDPAIDNDQFLMMLHIFF